MPRDSLSIVKAPHPGLRRRVHPHRRQQPTRQVWAVRHSPGPAWSSPDHRVLRHQRQRHSQRVGQGQDNGTEEQDNDFSTPSTTVTGPMSRVTKPPHTRKSWWHVYSSTSWVNATGCHARSTHQLAQRVTNVKRSSVHFYKTHDCKRKKDDVFDKIGYLWLLLLVFMFITFTCLLRISIVLPVNLLQPIFHALSPFPFLPPFCLLSPFQIWSISRLSCVSGSNPTALFLVFFK